MINYLHNFDISDVCQIEHSLMPCPDQYVADLESEFILGERESVHYYPNATAVGEKGTIFNNVIAVIFAMPYKNEFDCHERFLHMLKVCGNKNTVYTKRPMQMVFVNGISYHTGLGKDLSIEENEIKAEELWIDIFTQRDGYCDLIKRLNALKPKYVINLCKKGERNLFRYMDLILKPLSTINEYDYISGTYTYR